MGGSLCARFPLLVALCEGTPSPHRSTTAAWLYERVADLRGPPGHPVDPAARLALSEHREAHLVVVHCESSCQMGDRT